ncbi:LysR family transcriptional regulator [Janthinobacterium agaricidamnosum]|uniref:HTH-type transcriptional regulator yofA n=1 Tax=Janthinobacterium agaricidamnosum NBRC 102515 = DSM 9628 TaxID=1349767 RepID=W0UY40_9BURK|nr:LysR family transcriptional regulator [Janthinobacterium agaricidamnosum]CDG81469.1 HTH-type transcriptional regulator yofA [Janthinobacterium agaricidamnosum NBRC 102515 = DSM 9628]
MDLSALRIFKAVAEEGSVTKAAARLHRVQSNVSVRLTQLEESLGVTLFHRSGRRLLITAEGARLLQYTDRLLQLADEAEASMRGDRSPSGKLQIGAMETTAAARMPFYLAKFHRAHPEVELLLDSGPTDYLLQAVLSYRLDVALVAAPVERPELEQMTVFEEELVLLTDQEHDPVVTPHDVRKKSLLVFRAGCAYRRKLEGWFAEAGVATVRTIEFGTFEAIIGCVAAGMGVALMPKEILRRRDLADTVQVHQLPPSVAQISTVLVWRRDVVRHPARQAFADSFLA